MNAAILCLFFLVGCQRAAETLPPTPTALVIIVVATPAPSDTPPPTVLPATSTSAPTPPTATLTPRPTRAPATPTRPRATATPAPTPTPPDILLDGDYASAGDVRVRFTVSDGGTLASAGFFNYRCPADRALSTYGFADPAAIVGGKFAFSALPAPSTGPQVTMVCTALTLTQARCTIRNLLATNKCLDTPVTVNHK